MKENRNMSGKLFDIKICLNAHALVKLQNHLIELSNKILKIFDPGARKSPEVKVKTFKKVYF